MIAREHLIEPDWAAPAGALVSTRGGGVSAAPWDRLNLGVAVGDDPAAVAENRRRFAAACGVEPVWLRQVHGTRVLRLRPGDAGREMAAADAAWTGEPGVACAVLVADCLPVLMSASDGRAVAAAHAGWRGLAGGVLEAAVQALAEGAGCAAGELHAWLGPCIGPERFEVGTDVLEAFGADPSDAAAPSAARFTRRDRPDGSARWLADLPGLARDRLRAAGVGAVGGGRWCTASDASRFFSYRRDGVTGRMAAAVWVRG